MANQKKETRGRKPNSEKGKEVKKSYPAYLYPSDKEAIVNEHGSISVVLEKEAAKIKKRKKE